MSYMSTLRYLGGLTGLKQQPTPLVHSKLGHGGAKPSTNRRNSLPRPEQVLAHFTGLMVEGVGLVVSEHNPFFMVWKK